MKKQFSVIFSNLRKERSITQDQLGKALGITRQAISNYEKGLREPDYETLESIADYFNVDMSYLLGETEVQNKYRDFAKNQIEKLEDEFPEGVDVLRRGTEELSPAARKIMIKHMNQFIDDLAEMEKDED